MKLEDLDLSTRYAAELVSNQPLTGPDAAEEVRELVLELDTGFRGFEVGQSLAVLAPGDASIGQTHHVRLYTIADAPAGEQVKPEIKLCVRRCHDVDPFSGEARDGIASNFLCDLEPGATITVAGPFGAPFHVPQNRNAGLLMIGLGTGIAPFRAFVRHIVENLGGWSGKVRIFHGASSGLEMLYRNEAFNDFAQYMDQETFAAFEAVSPRPAWGEPVDFGAALTARQDEVRELLEHPTTHVYVAGLAPLEDALDAALARLEGGTEAWAALKAGLVREHRWHALIY